VNGGKEWKIYSMHPPPTHIIMQVGKTTVKSAFKIHALQAVVKRNFSTSYTAKKMNGGAKWN
jgi:hypothetical protein